MMFLLPGSTPRANAGNESVTKLTHKIWMAFKGTGQPKTTAKNNANTSPILHDSK